MGSPNAAHTSAYYIGYATGQLMVVAIPLILLVVGIVVAVRAKTATTKGCGIALAGFFGLLVCVFGMAFVVSFVEGVLRRFPHSGIAQSAGHIRAVQSKDGSCEISVPDVWLDSPDLNKEAVLGARNPGQTEYVIVFAESRQDYTGTLADYAQIYCDQMRARLTTPQIEVPQSITINGRSAVRQIFRGELNHLRAVFVVTHFEGQSKFYRVVCWSLESNAEGARADFDKVAESFQERKNNPQSVSQ
jgi:hypothetical protein